MDADHRRHRNAGLSGPAFRARQRRHAERWRADFRSGLPVTLHRLRGILATGEVYAARISSGGVRVGSGLSSPRGRGPGRSGNTAGNRCHRALMRPGGSRDSRAHVRVAQVKPCWLVPNAVLAVYRKGTNRGLFAKSKRTRVAASPVASAVAGGGFEPPTSGL